MQHKLFIAGIIFFLGSCLGSFANVCIYRLARGLSIFFPRSYCPACKHPVSIYDNIPILSFLWLRGKCRFCRSRISFLYPIIEIFYGMMLTKLFFQYGFSLTFLHFAIFFWILLVITVIDIQHQKILNKLTFSGIFIGFILSITALQWYSFFDALTGFFAGGGVLTTVYLLFKPFTGKEPLGMGDIKLAGMIGVFWGWQQTLILLLIGFTFGAILGILGLAFGYLKKNTRLPLAPFLSAAAFVLILLRLEIFNW